MSRGFIQLFGFLVLMSACFFGSAGKWNGTGGWVLVVLYLCGMVGIASTAMRKHPDPGAERMAALKKGKAWDKALVGVMTVIAPQNPAAHTIPPNASAQGAGARRHPNVGINAA